MQAVAPKILIAEDDEVMAEFISEALEKEGYSVSHYHPTSPNPALLESSYDAAILDIHMNQTDGFAIHDILLKTSIHTQFIFITGQPDDNLFERVSNLGGCSFLPKPFKTVHLRYSIKNALNIRKLQLENLMYSLDQSSKKLGLVGKSDAILKVKKQAAIFAALDVPVLVTGESGSGKEVVANFIHKSSSRAAEKYVVINCAGLTPSLVDSELFGHIRGSFTGAHSDKKGYFEVCDNGTLFLDEIGELPLEAQAKLLRILDNGCYQRVGDTETRRVNVRILSATNRDLKEMVREKTFRGDLYFRLRGTEIKVPPLRDRREDIPSLVNFFLRETGVLIQPAAMKLLNSLSWEGNIRELKLLITALSGICSEKIIRPGDIGQLIDLTEQSAFQMTETMSYSQFKKDVLNAHESAYFEFLLKQSNGNISQTARYAGLQRKQVYAKLKDLNLSSGL